MPPFTPRKAEDLGRFRHVGVAGIAGAACRRTAHDPDATVRTCLRAAVHARDSGHMIIPCGPDVAPERWIGLWTPRFRTIEKMPDTGRAVRESVGVARSLIRPGWCPSVRRATGMLLGRDAPYPTRKPAPRAGLRQMRGVMLISQA